MSNENIKNHLSMAAIIPVGISIGLAAVWLIVGLFMMSGHSLLGDTMSITIAAIVFFLLLTIIERLWCGKRGR